MKIPWIIDPKAKEESVTATLVVVSTIVMVTAIALEMAGKVKGTNLVTDFFWGSLATYMGRKLTFGKGQVAGVVAEDKNETK